MAAGSTMDKSIVVTHDINARLLAIDAEVKECNERITRLETERTSLTKKRIAIEKDARVRAIHSEIEILAKNQPTGDTGSVLLLCFAFLKLLTEVGLSPNMSYTDKFVRVKIEAYGSIMDYFRVDFAGNVFKGENPRAILNLFTDPPAKWVGVVV